MGGVPAQGQDVERAGNRPYQLFDRRGVLYTRNEKTISARVTIRVARHRACWSLASGAPTAARNTSVLALMTIGTPACAAASRAGLDFLNMKRDVHERIVRVAEYSIFQVKANSTRGDDAANSLGRILGPGAKAGDHVGRDRHDAFSDAAHAFNHRLTADPLAVGIA